MMMMMMMGGGLINSDLCDCGEVQTMSHIVNTCHQTRFDGGLEVLNRADSNAAN